MGSLGTLVKSHLTAYDTVPELYKQLVTCYGVTGIAQEPEIYASYVRQPLTANDADFACFATAVTANNAAFARLMQSYNNDLKVLDKVVFLDNLPGLLRAKVTSQDDKFTSLRDEFNVFQTINACSLPPTAKLLGSKWVFTAKRDETGNVTKYKARLIALGCHQRNSIDYKETFAPVAQFASICLLIALAASQGWPIIQADIDKAYLHSDLDKDLYLRIPQGVHGLQGKVLKLQRSLYGLKQARQTWNQKLNTSLEQLSFKALSGDQCIYRCVVGTKLYYIALYVDDLLFIGPDRAHIEAFSTDLSASTASNAWATPSTSSASKFCAASTAQWLCLNARTPIHC
ncbi:hypothetical protein ACM66B_006696 [Microbotryomycetes sp. NB124-2]